MKDQVVDRYAAAWPLRPLDELFEVIGGGTPPKGKAAYYGGDIPWATIRDMHSSELTRTEHTITALCGGDGRVSDDRSRIDIGMPGQGNDCISLPAGKVLRLDIQVVQERAYSSAGVEACKACGEGEMRFASVEGKLRKKGHGWFVRHSLRCSGSA